MEESNPPPPRYGCPLDWETEDLEGPAGHEMPGGAARVARTPGEREPDDAEPTEPVHCDQITKTT